jgi:site-specific recombinase XerD
MGSTAVEVSIAGGQRSHDGWNIITSLVLDGIASRHTRRAYSQALDEFLIWFRDDPGREFNKATVQKYRTELEMKGLAPSSINVRLSAIRRLALEAADNGLMSPDLAAGIARAKGAKRSGLRLGQWLTAEQAERLLAVPDLTKIKGIRDSAVIAVLLGAGLRRSELAGMNCDHVQNREGRWLIADLVGKHGRIRSVPIPLWAHEAVIRWEAAAGIIEGALFRRVNRHGQVTPWRISPQAVFAIVKSYAETLEFDVGPHDLRRSFARLAHLGHTPLEQIQLSLGHASVVTTEIYLGVKQNLRDAPCDHLGLMAGLEVSETV